MNNISRKDCLLALSNYFDGNWKEMLNCIQKKRMVLTQDDVRKAYSKTKSFFVNLLDDDFPLAFKSVLKTPFLLYYYGNLNLLEKPYRLTCVGTRKPTFYQAETCYKFIQEVERKLNNEVVIISGMAAGIDQTCMKAAMDLNAPLITILGSGIDNPYPKNNYGIYQYCKEVNGLILSEYPRDISAKPENFLFRNRLLAAAAPVVFIGGGKNRSGTARTISYALDMGKEVAALPCDVSGDDLTNTIIKEGANSILTSDDLVELLVSSNQRLEESRKNKR